MFVVSRSSRYSLQKNYRFEFVKVISKVGLLSVPFFPGRGFLAKMAFFNDVTITSSLRSVVQVLMGYFTIFQSHGLSG